MPELEACPECFRMPFDREPHGEGCTLSSPTCRRYTIGFVDSDGISQFIYAYAPNGVVRYSVTPGVGWLFSSIAAAQAQAQTLPTSSEPGVRLPSRWRVMKLNLVFVGVVD